MKKTQFIELLHVIGKTWVSFFSIVMFVALGAGIFLGIHWASQALQVAANKTYTSQNFHDFDISNVYGITQDDVATVAAVDGVSQVEGGYTTFATFQANGQKRVARIMSILSDIDQATCVEGELPTTSNELALDSVFAKKNGIKVGDTITFDSDANSSTPTLATLSSLGSTDSTSNAGSAGATTDATTATDTTTTADTTTGGSSSSATDDGMKYLNGATYTVTALVEQPAYISTSRSTRGMTTLAAGSADCFVLLPVSAFDTAAYDGCYTNLYVRCSAGNDMNSFGKGYTQALSDVKTQLAEIAKTNGHARYQAIYDAAQAKIDDGQKQIDDAKAKIADGDAQVATAQQTIADGEVQIADGEAQIADAQSQVDDAEAQLSDAKDTLDYYQSQADDAEARINSAIYTAAGLLKTAGVPGTEDEIADKLWGILDTAANSEDDISDIARSYGIPEEYISQYASLADSALGQYRYYLEKKAELQDGWDEYYYYRDLLDDKEAQLEDGKAKLEDAKAKLEDGKTQLAQKQTELADAKTQLADAEVRLQDAKDKLAKLTEYDWTIATRSSNISAIWVSAYEDVTDRLRLSMASLFLLVGLFVCYTAVSRIVREQVVSIGTKKALGLRGREITISYLLYSAFAVIIGIVLGAILAVVLLEGILNQQAIARFSLPAIPPYFSLLDTIEIGIIELVLICLATWFACRHMLHRQAVDLLKGEEPPKNKIRFYEKWKVWDRMPLYSQSIINNFFNDKLRVVGTLVGIAGCTALVVTAMTLYVDVNDTFTTQYKDVYAYDSSILFDSTVDGAESSLLDAIDQAGAKGAAVMKKTLIVSEPSGNTAVATMEVPEDPATFLELYHINSLNGGRQSDLSDDGVWVSQAYATHQNAKIGDTIDVTDTSGMAHELTIAGIFEYHLNHHEIVMSPAYYEKVFGSTPTPSAIIIDTDGTDTDQLVEKLRGIDGFFSYTNDYETDKAQFESYQSLTRTMVYIYLVLSALMALMVLMNLTVMFIEEKKRDLIVLMINGFSIRDAKRYIYRDNIVLTVIGIILGLLLGMLMGYLSVVSIQFDTDAYVLTPSWVACLSGIIVCAFFALVVNLIALRKIPNFKLTDINKM